VPGSLPNVNGFYTLAYNEIVRPNQVWATPKYLLRRWGPYLSPTRFWTVVAAQQLAYWGGGESFEAYDAGIADAASISRIHYRRIKAEMGETQNPLSLFITKSNTEYHVVDGVTRPKPTTYHVRLDVPLTPADAHHMMVWLQSQQATRKSEEVAALLKSALQFPRKELLAPQLAPYLKETPAQFRNNTVADVVEAVFGRAIARQPAVQETAEALHLQLTDDDFVGKQYFRSKWVNALKPGPAFMVVYLRSQCFYDEETGELRNLVTFKLPDLADSLGVDVKTLSRWIDSVATAVTPQAIPPFLNLIEKRRIPGNEVEFTYEVGMVDPLTENDLNAYRALLAQSEGQNDIHDNSSGISADRQNDIHAFSQEKWADGQNDIHRLSTDGDRNGQNDIHDPGRTDKMIAGHGQNDNGSRTKRFSLKYYKTLLQALDCEDENTFLTLAIQEPLWKLGGDQAAKSFAAAAVDNLETLLGQWEVDTAGPTRPRIRRGGLTLEQIVAWYLYALQQRGLKSPVTYTLSRAGSGKHPPGAYLQLANLSWELWRCYASLLVLPPDCRAEFQHSPGYVEWMNCYGRCRPSQLPFAVGEGVEALASLLQPMNRRASLVDNPHQILWQTILAELKLRTGKAFDLWLVGSTLRQVQETADGQKWTVVVRNDQAVDWLTNRLNRTVIEPLVKAMNNDVAASITYVIEHKTQSSRRPDGRPDIAA
jgi:hypothetical protein